MCVIKMFCLGLFLWLAAVSARSAEPAAPEFLAKNWRNEDGLPNSIINSILQTRDGYLWIGTYVGLARFDGVRFSNYSSSNVPELESGMVSCLFEDHLGRLWIALENGRLISWKEGVAHIQVGSGTQAVISMAETKDDTLWVQRKDGKLGRLTDDGIVTVAECGQMRSRGSLGIYVDANDRLWVGTIGGLKVWRNNTLSYPEGVKQLAPRAVDIMSLAHDGSILVCQNRHFWKLNEQSVTAEIEIPQQLSDVVVLQQTSDGRIWAGARDGKLLCLDTNQNWIEISNTSFSGSNRVLYEDHEGNVWRGSFGGGLARIRPRAFKVYKVPGIINTYPRAVTADSLGNISWVLNDQALAYIPFNSHKPTLWTNQVPIGLRTLYSDRKDTFWVGAGDAELYRYANRTFVSELKTNIQGEYISAFFEDSDTNLWVGYKGGYGVGFFPPNNPTNWHHVTGLSYPDVCTIAQAGDGAMWFGTHYGGAFRFQDGQLRQFTKRDGLCSDYVRCFYVDTNGPLWLGTMHGLCRWQKGTFASVTSEHGLWNDSISCIEDAGDGYLWISSFGGVFRVKLDDLNQFADGKRDAIQCIGYNQSDGLEGLECSGGCQPAGTRTPDGRLWFLTASGLASVNPKEIKENLLPPPVWIEGLNIDGKPVAITHSTSVINVPPGKRRFDFQFTALSLVAPEKVRFRHKLEGLETEWSAADGQRSATYNYIPPGKYTFSVVACNNDAVWNTTGQTIHLKIQPYYWQTWWFKTAVGLSLVVLLVSIVQRFERLKARIRIENLQQRDAIERERSRIAKDIHDDLGASLTQVVFLSQRVENRTNTELERCLKNVNITMRRTIQSLDEIVWAINARHDSLESLANYLSQFARKHLDLAGIKCLLDIPTVVPVMGLSAEVRHNLMLAAREALQNVVAHAKATEVRVFLELAQADLRIEIADNGAGFDPHQNGTDGDGLSNMRKRLEAINGQLEIVSQPGGTKVRFSVSCKRLSSPPLRHLT